MGNDISASASVSSSAATGATRFGAVNTGSAGISNTVLIVVAGIAGLLGVVFFLMRRRGA